MAKKTNADYCAAYRAREEAKAARLEVVDVTFALPRGIRDKFAELRKQTGQGDVELLSNMILAAANNPELLQPPRAVITDNDPIFKHLKRSNQKEALRDDNY